MDVNEFNEYRGWALDNRRSTYAIMHVEADVGNVWRGAGSDVLEYHRVILRLQCGFVEQFLTKEHFVNCKRIHTD